MRASTLTCESGVWNSSVIRPCTTEMSLGASSRTTVTRTSEAYIASGALFGGIVISVSGHRERKGMKAECRHG